MLAIGEHSPQGATPGSVSAFGPTARQFPNLSKVGYNGPRRAPAHCGMANLVRSGTKQPRLLPISAADQARLLRDVLHGSTIKLPWAAFLFSAARFSGWRAAVRGLPCFPCFHLSMLYNCCFAASASKPGPAMRLAPAAQDHTATRMVKSQHVLSSPRP